MEITLGVLHIVMALTSRGPRITEIGAHLAGDLIPLLVKKATGVNLPQAAADLASGETPNLTPTLQRAAAIHFAYSNRGGHIERLEVSSSTSDPLIDRFVLTQQPGRYVEPVQHASVEDRLAHWIVLGSNKASCHNSLDQAAQRLRIALSHGAQRTYAA
jgi:hypothetical protein